MFLFVRGGRGFPRPLRFCYKSGMVIPLDPKKELVLVCESDRDLSESEQNRFKIRALSAREQAQVQNESVAVSAGGGEASTTVKTGAWAIAVLNLGLLGWENFPPGEDDDLPFKAQGSATSRKVSDATLSRIPSTVRNELAAAIWDGDLGEDEAKN